MITSAATSDSPRVRLYPYGTWPENDNAHDPPTELGQRLLDWLQGKPVPLDDRLSAALQVEFASHERFRVQLVQAVAKCANQLKAAAGAATEGLDVPFARTEEFASGYRSGLYRAHSEDASAIAHTINSEIAELARDSERIRAERLARLGKDGDDAGQTPV